MISKQKIVEIYKHFKIPYWISGKNVSEGWINIQCPFCSDKSNHCGVDLSTGFFNCWRCSSSGPFERLLQGLTGYSEKECIRLIKKPYYNFKKSSLDQIKDTLNTQDVKEESQGEVVEISMPEYSQPVTWNTRSKLLDIYLKRRKIELSTLIKYKCSICEVGYYMHRLIVPIYYKNKLVSYQAADMTGRARVKYDSAPGKINDYLYNYDCINKRMILVEGVLDAWRIGKDVCASFGAHITKNQEKLILDKNLDELIFCWDSDAFWRAKKEAKFLEYAIEKVTVIKLPTREDPDSLGKEKLDELVSKY